MLATDKAALFCLCLAWSAFVSVKQAGAQYPTGYNRQYIDQGQSYSGSQTPYYWSGNRVYYPNSYAPSYPFSPYGYGPGTNLPAPVAATGGLYGINRGGAQYFFWKSPTGYYYPWVKQPYYNGPSTIIYMQEGSSKPAEPPLATIFADMKKYLDESREKNKVSQADYNHLNLRLSDLLKMEQSARLSGGGSISSNDESDIRSKLNDLGAEIAQRIKSF